jgi:hypothetical protein
MAESPAKRARFPTTAEMAAEGLDAADRAAVRSLVALGISKRTQAELEADAASAKTSIATCAPYSTDDLKMLILLAEAAEGALKKTGGRRRQRGGGIGDAIKYVLTALCGVVGRGVAFTAAQTEDAVRQFGVALETMTDAAAARRVNAVIRRLLTGATTTAAIYDLAQGPDGYIGSIVVAFTSAMYAAAPNALTALQAIPGAAATAGAASAGVAGTYVSVAAVTYASALILNGIRDGVRAIRDAPNPTDPAQIHEVLRQCLAFASRGRIRLGAYVAPRGAPRDVDGGPELHPGENEDGRRVNVLLLEDGGVEAIAAGAAGIVEEGGDIGGLIGMSAADIAGLKARNAARFGGPGGAAGRGGRRHTRKHRSRRRHHTRKH